MQAALWVAAGAALAVAIFSGWRDHARARRDDLDAVGWVDWRSVQMAALLTAMILVGLAFRG